jgi:hypothetical protein
MTPTTTTRVTPENAYIASAGAVDCTACKLGTSAPGVLHYIIICIYIYITHYTSRIDVDSFMLFPYSSSLNHTHSFLLSISHTLFTHSLSLTCSLADFL